MFKENYILKYKIPNWVKIFGQFSNHLAQLSYRWLLYYLWINGIINNKGTQHFSKISNETIKYIPSVLMIDIIKSLEKIAIRVG